MKSITIEEYYRSDRFVVVNTFPKDYIVWNIGREHFPVQGYIPLALVDDNWQVDLSSLKTLKCPSDRIADVVLGKAHRQTVDKEEYQKIIATMA